MAKSDLVDVKSSMDEKRLDVVVVPVEVISLPSSCAIMPEENNCGGCGGGLTNNRRDPGTRRKVDLVVMVSSIMIEVVEFVVVVSCGSFPPSPSC